MNLDARLSSLAAAPKPWRYRITYADGRERVVPCLSEAAARNGAARYSAKVGRALIGDNGETVTMIAVTVELNSESVA